MGAFLSWTTKAGQAKSLFFDVCTEEGQELTSTATEHPIEDGANVADHVKRELDRVMIEVFVSNAPIYDFNGKGGSVQTVPIKPPKYKAPLAPTPGAVFGAVGNLAKEAIGFLLGKSAPEYGAKVLKWSSAFDAVGDALTELEKIRDDVQLVDVVLPSRVYENMHLEHIQISGNAGTGTGRTFRLDFRELRKVRVSLVNAPKAAEVRAKPMQKKGTQSGKEVPEGPKKSVAKSAVDAIKKRLKGDAS